MRKMNQLFWQGDCPEIEHHFHAYRGPIHMVVPDGHIVQKCCKCEKTRVVHADHAHEARRG